MVTQSIPVAFTAKTAAEAAVKPLFADLAVIRKQLRPRGKKGTPIDLEVHINPIGIGAGIAAFGLALWLAQLRVGTTADGYAIKERQGFLGNGSGTPISGFDVSANPIVKALLGSAWSPWW